MAKTLYQKIVEAHTVKSIDANTVLLYCDIHFANEYTSPQAFAGLHSRHLPVLSPDSHLCVVDHIIPTHDEEPRRIYDEASLTQAKTLQSNCEHFGISAFYGPNSPDQGIEHVVMQEQGLVRPGMVVICGDSHTTTHGALGALGFGIGTSEIEHILATQTLVYRMAGTMRITVNGQLHGDATAKDLVLAVLREISARGALGLVVEWAGEAIRALKIEDRMTICNLTVEAGARGALVAPDEKAIDWVIDHAKGLSGEDIEAMWAYCNELHSDENAIFDNEVTFDAGRVKPMVTWGTSPDQAIAFDEKIPTPDSFGDPIARQAAKRALEYQNLKPGSEIVRSPIEHVFIGSCTNSRLCDLQAAAQVLKGRHVAAGVRAQVVPGSMRIRRQAEELGLDRIFKDAGFEWRKSGCSLCLAMNDDILKAGTRCASTTNRNFEGRQGRGSHTHLVSPETAAASAVMGYLCPKSELEE
ncbi:3-isopropylmalate dehydratase large subunit [Parasutterella secunda]|uniref:3-isopropylmalate dehydratase n=1 Tax=Parasutterella secunda TaxID=626947 RepID=A0ABS2GTK3_9BURK|nr:3-isopropylmalate dehydratase large subunit [Parasutterella secunda]MBM6929190.1 3-isopropylmalate dehydratase large subunit [Parasutterella secunda]